MPAAPEMHSLTTSSDDDADNDDGEVSGAVSALRSATAAVAVSVVNDAHATIRADAASQ